LPSLQQNFTHTHCSSSSFIVTLSLIRQTACACAQFGGCSSATNSHSETRQMAICCQNLPLGALSSRSALPVPVGALFKKFGLYLNNPCRSLSPKVTWACCCNSRMQSNKDTSQIYVFDHMHTSRNNSHFSSKSRLISRNFKILSIA